MNDVSVQHIGALYDFCQSAGCFLNEIEAAINQIKNELDLLLAESYTHISRIQNALEGYKADVDDMKVQIDDLRDQMRDEENAEIRREISEEIQNCREDLSEAKEKVQLCEDDLRHAEVLHQETINRISMIKSNLDELRGSVTNDIEISTDFIRKYANYLQNTTITI